MSIGRRILDGVNSVMESLAADDTPLSHVNEAELRRELQARIDAREKKTVAPRDNPGAKWAGASGNSREHRAKAASIREARLHKAERERAARDKAAQDRAFREAKAQATRQTSAGRGRASYERNTESRRTSGGSSSSSSRRSSRGFGRKNSKLAAHYKTLDMPMDAEFAVIKKQFRKLMRKYHPDRHVGDAKKQKAATELSMRITEAFTEIELHLNGKG